MSFCAKWPLIWVFPFTFVADITASSTAYIRYRQGKWRQQLTEE